MMKVVGISAALCLMNLERNLERYTVSRDVVPLFHVLDGYINRSCRIVVSIRFSDNVFMYVSPLSCEFS